MISTTDRKYSTEVAIDIARRRRSDLARKFGAQQSDNTETTQKQDAILKKLDQQINTLENRLLQIISGDQEDLLHR